VIKKHAAITVQAATLILPWDQATASTLHTKVALALNSSDTNPSSLAHLGNDSVIVTEAKHKKCILQEYERDFGKNNQPKLNCHKEKR
jgi:hypothetical protein